MHKSVKNLLEKAIEKEIHLEKPKKRELGHYASPIAFSLAKELRKNPKLIAEEICEKLSIYEELDSVEAVSGFVNIKLSSGFLDSFATSALKNPQEFAKSVNSEKILLEYVSANPTGPLHIGHARGAIIGSSLYNIGKHLGYEIDTEYYVNDAGNQINLLGLSILLASKKLQGLEVEYPESYYRGEYIDDIAKLAISKYGESFCIDEASITELSEFGKELMLEEIKENLKCIGVSFDNYVSESEVLTHDKETFIKLQKNDASYIKDGKTWIKSELFGDEKDRVIIRESGEPTYLAGDIIYHNQKFLKEYDRYINIWGADHHGYIARVRAAIKHLGYDESKLEVILSQMVSLLKNGEPYKMSKRAGNFILLKDVVDEIGKDALRFIFLSKKADTHLEFDVEDLKKEDSSNPIYYINYAYARINTMFEKSGISKEEVISQNQDVLGNEELLLLFEALLLPQILEDAFSKREMQRVTEYLKSLASMFHSFYNRQKVIGSENEKAYLKLASMVALSLKTGLNLIGVEPKERM
ncbi:MAG: arginine--tRNA ligase [Campylobacterales bacterium]